jgi:hypothetical protein
MLCFRSDSSLFRDFRKAIFRSLADNDLNLILVGLFPPKAPAGPGPRREDFCIRILIT